MPAGRERKLSRPQPRAGEPKLALSDPGRDAAGDELELIFREAEEEDPSSAEDSGAESFLDRLPPPRAPRPRD